MHVLILNAGSSSLKAAVMSAADGTVLAQASADWAGTSARYRYSSAGADRPGAEVACTGHAAAVRKFLSDIAADTKLPHDPPAAVGHRIVHGGDFTAAVRITPEVRSRILDLTPLAPLHNPPSLQTLAAAEEELPDVPHVAVFDTSFHATLPPEACTYPVPARWTSEWRIRRYGFHGLSHAYCAQRAADLLGRPLDELRLVICHLGHGCSATAVQGGRSVDTTMGFTPLDGLMMATRSGSVDPGILLHVQRQHGLTAADLETVLNRQSGLLGVSGISGDMRAVLAAAESGNEAAALALSIYAHRARQAIGALAVTMGGLDVLVFTAGVGEHAAAVREMICNGLECLGLQLDPRSNAACRPDADIAAGPSQGRILVIATREDVTMLREVLAVLGATRAAGFIPAGVPHAR